MRLTLPQLKNIAMNAVNEATLPKSFTKQENWAWDVIKNGEEVDFNKKYNQKLNPKEFEGLEQDLEGRTLSNDFLNAIFTHWELKEHISSKGVRIVGAYFNERIDLNYIRSPYQFWMDKCLFTKEVHIEYAKIEGLFSLEGSVFKEDLILEGSSMTSANLSAIHCEKGLNANSIEVEKSFFLRKSEGHLFELAVSKIGDDLEISNSTIQNKLDLNSITVGNNLLLHDGGSFNDIDLIAAHIGGRLDLSSSYVRNKLDLNSITIERDVLLNESGSFNNIDLIAAHIGGWFDLSNSKFNSILELNSIQIGKTLRMNNSEFVKNIDLSNAVIYGQVEIISSIIKEKIDFNSSEFKNSFLSQGKSSFNNIDFSNSRIEYLELADIIISNTINLAYGSFSDELKLVDVTSKDLILNSVSVERNVFIQNCKSNTIDLAYGSFSGELKLADVTSKDLILNSVSVERNVFIQNCKSNTIDLAYGSFSGELNIEDCKGTHVWLNDTYIQKNLTLTNCEFIDENEDSTKDINSLTLEELDKKSIFHNCQCNGSVQINKFNFGQLLLLNEVVIGHHLSISGESIPNLWLVSSSIKGRIELFNIDHMEELVFISNKSQQEFIIDNSTIKCAEINSSNLQSLKVKTSNIEALFMDNTEIFKEFSIDLDTFDTITELLQRDFSYKKIVIGNNHDDDFTEYLNLSSSYEPDAYEQLANFLSHNGHHDRANEVKFASRERKRSEAYEDKDYINWLGLTLLNYTVGYGIGKKIFRVMIWFIAFATFGMIILELQTPYKDYNSFELFWASFDNTLPLVKLNDNIQQIVNGANQIIKLFFYIQELLGFVLGGFLVAGLSGLTQNPK